MLTYEDKLFGIEIIMRPVHQCSLFSIYLEPIAINLDGGVDRTLAGATGFLMRHDSTTYLVSNYHVLSGRNARTDQPMDPGASLPSKVRVHFLFDTADLDSRAIDFDLKDSSENPLWQQHPAGAAVDIAALPIIPPVDIVHFYLDEITRSSGVDKDFFHVNQEVSIIGFPLSPDIGGRLPIWKRSVIATQPFSSFSGDPRRVLVDTGSRPGMSGSPVIYCDGPVYALPFDSRNNIVEIPSFKHALGIYSGRYGGEDVFSAQLGIVWSIDAIYEVLLNPRF